MKRTQSSTWKEYFEHTKNKPPRPILVQALSYVSEKGKALDLGAGALNESVYLVSEGFMHVTALDKTNVAHAIADILPSEHFTYKITTFEEFEFPKSEYDLVNAQYALPFIHPDSFQRVISSIYDSLKQGGVFVGQFFGNRDEWKTNSKMTFVTKDMANDLLSAYTVNFFEEEEKDKPTAAGEMKHWHIFHFIAEKM